MAGIIEQLLSSRGLSSASKKNAFCAPSYEDCKYDPFLLPDMLPAVERLKLAREKEELVYIYGDYDIDGLSATTLLLDAFASFNIKAKAYIPNRFTDGYGLSKTAIGEIAQKGAQLIVTVDCGSLSHNEIAIANQLGVDVIVTDHHSVAETMPPAVATINPKRSDHSYNFIDLAGVGVAFKLVQAMQQKMSGLPNGQEKWLLDLVALGTVCDVVQLVDENRANVFWGLQVMTKTRRTGLRSMASVAGLNIASLDSRSLGFVIGPHLNAAGRLETANYSLELLTTTNPERGLEIAYKLKELNTLRRAEQDRIFKEAAIQAQNYPSDPVLVLNNENWSHGIIGIVAAKILEEFKKPTFILEELGDQAKGSARSFGDFSAVDAINFSKDWLIKGGGHKLAAGVTLKTKDIVNFRQAVNDFYRSKSLQRQHEHFEPKIDATVEDIAELNYELFNLIKTLEPFGHGNPEPIFMLPKATIHRRQELGAEGKHLKLNVFDNKGQHWEVIGFGDALKYHHKVGDDVSVWFKLIENTWRGSSKLEGRLVKLASLGA